MDIMDIMDFTGFISIMGWVLLAFGSLVLGLAAWMTWKAFRRAHSGERSELLARAAGGVVMGWLLLYFGTLMASQFADSAVWLGVWGVGAIALLAGIWIAWYGPHRVRRMNVAYRDASPLATLYVMTLITICEATGMFMGGAGLYLITMLFPATMFTALMGIISGVGCVVSICACGPAAWMGLQLKNKMGEAAWRGWHGEPLLR